MKVKVNCHSAHDATSNEILNQVQDDRTFIKF